MTTPQTAKYIKTQVYEKSHHPEYTSDPIRLVPHLDFGVLSEDGIHRETHTITKATSIFVPKGLYHCPLVYKRVDKPFYFIEIFFADQYIQGKIQ